MIRVNKTHYYTFAPFCLEVLKRVAQTRRDFTAQELLAEVMKSPDLPAVEVKSAWIGPVIHEARKLGWIQPGAVEGDRQCWSSRIYQEQPCK